MSGMLFFHCINTALLHQHMVPTSCKHPFDHSCTVAVWTLTTAALWLYDLWPQLHCGCMTSDHSCTVAVWPLTTAALWLYDPWPQLRLNVLHWSSTLSE